MMNICYNKPIEVNGYLIHESNGGNFQAENKEGIIFFLAEGRNGGLYFNVTGYYNKISDKRYNAQRYLYKHIHTIGGIAFFLADNNYLWDYIQQKPFLESRETEKKKYDQKRVLEGKKPIYE